MASENIIIEISADAQKLTPVIDQLVKLGQVSAKDAEEFKKIAAASQVVTTETLKTTEAVKASATATTQASAVKQAALEKEKAQLQELSNLSKKAADPASAQRFAAAIKESETRIKGLNTELNKTPKPVKDADTAFKSLRTQLLEARNEAVRLAEKFGEFSPQAIAAANAAAKIDDKVKDLNRTLQALNPEQKFGAFVQIGVGVSGAFTAAQGAMALFGNESEDVQKALLKVQAALAITQGLQSVLGLKDAFRDLRILLGITSVAQNTLAISTGVATGVQEGQVAVTKGATIAQRALNAAMNSNPIVLLVASLGALLAAYLLLRDSQEENIKLSSEQIEKNNQEAASLRTLRGEVSKIQLEIDKTKGTKTELEFNLAINKQQFDEDLAKIKDDIIVASNKIREVVEKELPQVNADELGRSLRARNAKNELGLQQKSDTDIQKEVERASAARLEEIRKRFKELADSSEFGLTSLHEKEKILREKFAKEDELAIAAQQKKQERPEDIIKIEKIEPAISKLGQLTTKLIELQAAIESGSINAVNKLTDEFDALAKSMNTQAIQEFNEKLNELNKARVDNAKKTDEDVTKNFREARKKEIELQKELNAQLQELGEDFTDFFFDSIQNQFDANIANLEELKDARLASFDEELEDLEELNNNKIISDGLYVQKKKALEKEREAAEKAANKRIAEEKRKAFIADRTAAIAKVAIDTALSISKTAAAIPFPAVIPFLAIAAATGALQLAAILSQPILKFKKGVLDLQGLGTGESDSIPAMLSKGESVMTAKETKMFMPTLSAIRKNLIPAEVMNKFVVEGSGGKMEAFIDPIQFDRLAKKRMGQQAELTGKATAKYLKNNSVYSPIRGEWVN